MSVCNVLLCVCSVKDSMGYACLLYYNCIFHCAGWLCLYTWRSAAAFPNMRHCPSGDHSNRQIRTAKGICLCRICRGRSYTRGSTTEWIRVAWSSIKGTHVTLYHQTKHFYDEKNLMIPWFSHLAQQKFRSCLRERTFLEWNSFVVDDSIRTWVTGSADLSCLLICIPHMDMGKFV